MNRTLATVIGIAMIACGIAVIVVSLRTSRPVTGSRVIDVAFTLFFFVRGAMQLRVARRAPRAPYQ